jgi:pilus assembly protein CpaB
MSARRRATLLLGLALVLGGLAASDVARRESALRAELAPLVDVVVARSDLAAGHRLAARDLARRPVPARFAPAGAAGTPPELLAGRRLAVPVVAGGPVGPLLLEPAAPPSGAGVGRGRRAAEVVATAAPDTVAAGARVDVLVTRDGQPGAAAGTQLALEDVEVLAARRAPDAADDGADRVAATLRVSVEQAVYLAAAQSFAREVRLLPRAVGDRGRTGDIAVGPQLR